jgi:Rieske Fe-S protein
MSLKGFAKLASENLDAVGHLTSDRFRRVRAGVPEDLKPGEAGVFSGGVVERIAAYRDDHGVLHEMDATCPHFKCQVDWNPAERTWDCPCHGSRFSATGDVVQAPALGGLSPIKAEAKKRT